MKASRPASLAKTVCQGEERNPDSVLLISPVKWELRIDHWNGQGGTTDGSDKRYFIENLETKPDWNEFKTKWGEKKWGSEFLEKRREENWRDNRGNVVFFCLSLYDYGNNLKENGKCLSNVNSNSYFFCFIIYEHM